MTAKEPMSRSTKASKLQVRLTSSVSPPAAGSSILPIPSQGSSAQIFATVRRSWMRYSINKQANEPAVVRTGGYTEKPPESEEKASKYFLYFVISFPHSSQIFFCCFRLSYCSLLYRGHLLIFAVGERGLEQCS